MAETDDGTGAHVLRMTPFTVVALGASAGGLEALRQLFAHLPADSGIGFVVIQHLDPDRPSMLTKVLVGVTAMRVVEAASGMRLEPNQVHVIPSGSDLTIESGILALSPRQRTGRLHLPIDTFLRSLAEDVKDRAIGVIFSGSGADGAEGLRAIKAEGGIAMAQEPDSAQFRSMPESAISSGVVDYRGTPEQIAGELVRLGREPYVGAAVGAEIEGRESELEEGGISRVLALVRQQAGMDFSSYKRTTVSRRVERRMAIRRSPALREYVDLLRSDAGEARALAQDMLIHVTSFFRDPGAFEALKEQVFHELVHRKQEGESVRIWVPGCSTGEEAYAITTALLESLDGSDKQLAVKVFGSDLSHGAIETARAGWYSEAALAEVSPERIARFFEPSENGHRIGKQVRDLVVFVKHDLTRDPPFAKLDLISCRNVLIYFDAELQRRVIPMLHYCLNKPGYLFLGKSETITGFRDLFAPVDKDHRIFVKTGESGRLAYPLPVGREAEVQMAQAIPVERREPAREAQRHADHLQLSRYAPPGAIVNGRFEIVQFRGRTGAYFEPAPGQPQASIFRMAREGLAANLHEALERAKAQSTIVRKEGLRIQDGPDTRWVDLEVVPLGAPSNGSERYFLVAFEEPGNQAAKVQRAPERGEGDEQGAAGAALEVERLKAELIATNDYVQSLVSEHQVSSDDLAAANEELVASNEELQSTNEELQSAKEELQSTNEELGTVNDELRNRNQALDEIANDLVNVLASVDIPVIIVDLALRVRRFTPTVMRIASFIPEDVGRPIDDLKLRMQVDDLPARINGVIENLTPKEWEVQDQRGCWFRMQIRPYRTSDNRLDGAVLSFVEVDALKRAIEDAEVARDYARSIVESVPSALVVLDGDLRVVSANQAFHQMFGLAARAEQKGLFELAGLDVPTIRRALGDVLTGARASSSFELTTEASPGRRRTFSLTGRSIVWRGGSHALLLAIDDVTAMRTLESERALLLESEKQSRIEAERANHAKDLFLATLSHELRTPLSTMLMSAQVLSRLASDDPRIQRASATIERSARAQSRLIDDLLDVSRIVSGKMILDFGSVDLAGVVQEAIEAVRPVMQSKGIALDVDVKPDIGAVYGDGSRLQQVVNNLLNNAIKFTPHGGHIAVRLERNNEQAELAIADSGMGIRQEVLPRLFSRFVQADSSVTRTHGGLGLGLAIVRHIVEVHGGTVQAESAGEGKGATFRVALPAGAPGPMPAPDAHRTTVHSIEGIRVLLVEDDDDAREMYTAMLAHLGAEVRSAAGAAAGLTELQAFRPQVLLSDIAMPGEDGFSFIQKVRRLAPDRGGRVPAAAITALASDEDRQRALQAGFQIHVAKPIDSVRLAGIVSMLKGWTVPSEPEPERPSSSP